MDAEDLTRLADARAEELPGSGVSQPFGPGVDVYKVCDKVFMLLMDRPGGPLVNLKADPADAVALCEGHPEITPGYHMNKKHWISVGAGDSVDEALLRDLVTESYLLVVEGLPRRLRPVDPATFGR